jgi:glycosyltransferase involved in cell wall biosynthesis
MPVYNEKETIEEVVSMVLAQRPVRELIIVDDASTDGTAESLEKIEATHEQVRVLRHEFNQGKGAALRTGFRHAEALYVVVQDADLEYDPREYHALLEPVLSKKADLVLGSRFIGAGPHRVLYYWHSVGNRLITTLSNIFTNLNLTDVECCYKLFRLEVLKQVTIEENRFGIEPEIVAKMARLRMRIYEVPVSYYGRTYSEGKKIGWRDGFSAIRCIVKYNLFG